MKDIIKNMKGSTKFWVIIGVAFYSYCGYLAFISNGVSYNIFNSIEDFFVWLWYIFHAAIISAFIIFVMIYVTFALSNVVKKFNNFLDETLK